MNEIRLLTLTVALEALLLCLRCSTSPTANGSGSTTETAKVLAGILYEPDGKTPANNAIVQFVPSNNMPGLQLNKTQATTYSTTTNSSGQYFADSLPAGYYNIFGSQGEDLCYAESVIVNDSTPLPKDTLKSPGSLKGVIRLAPGQDSRHVLILIFGTNNFASPLDSIGNFLLSNMAEGKYHVRLLATGGGYNYLPLDTFFSILSGVDEVLTDTMFLRLDSLAAPMGISTKAPGTGTVQITWQKTNEAIVYSIYRNTADTGIYTYIGHTIDTFYDDGVTLDNGSIYYYEVQATNSMAVSPLSKPCSALTVPAAPDTAIVKAIADSQIQITWPSIRSATRYRIFIDTEFTNKMYDSTMFTIDTVDTVKGIDYREQVYYYVRAYNSSGGSDLSQRMTIPIGTIMYTLPFFADSAGNLRPALGTDLISVLYDANGNALSDSTTGLETGDHIFIDGAIGGSPIPSKTFIFSQKATILQDLCDSIRSAFSLPSNDATPEHSLSVSVNNLPGAIPLGSIVVRGKPGEVFQMNNVSITADNSNNNSVSPGVFNVNMGIMTIQTARD